MGPEGSNLRISESGQEFFVLDQLGYKQNGYFIDIGASDGVTASNTFILEKFYKWQGVCVDPNPSTLKSLCGARDSIISDLCVYNESGKILPFRFLEDQTQFFGWNLRSGIEGIIEDPGEDFAYTNVYSITLSDLIKLYKAPPVIDYISLDCEGSESLILDAFDWSVHINTLTVEFENEQNRQNILNILEKQGFQRHIRCDNEDWYVNNTIK